ncbi:MAG: hypothetical protein IPJ00_17505 [Saprospirales bacterium]|nr:hypothetical protein [Saprospirales bacterium]
MIRFLKAATPIGLGYVAGEVASLSAELEIVAIDTEYAVRVDGGEKRESKAMPKTRESKATPHTRDGHKKK